ncbi:hypothetical protein ACHIPZ_26850 [Antrihabitans sp. NCIMB 15449]|uniref:Alkaline shock response membrane anchor protein AmaP n=1 Tax=Antrihabitans spumae TaxID=3373370 RepID=A0ABW7JW64_9NOCA
MNRLIVGIDRAVLLVVALALLVLGALLLLWRGGVEIARDVFAHADRRWYQLAPQQVWWDWVIAGVAVGALILGVWLLLANLRRHRLGSVEVDGTDELGTLTVNTGQVGNAVATMIAQHPAIQSASARAIVDRGRRTLRITVVAEPDVSLDHIRRIAANSLRDVDIALAGANVVTQLFVRYLPARHN